MSVKFISNDKTIVDIKVSDLSKYPESYLTTLSKYPEYFNKSTNAYPVRFGGEILTIISLFYKTGKWVCKISIDRMNFHNTKKNLGLQYSNLYASQTNTEGERWRNYEYGAMFEIEDVC